MYDSLIPRTPGTPLGHGVQAPPRERSTAGDPPQTHQRASYRAVHPDRLLGVGGAGGMESALAPEPAAQDEPIRADEPEEREAGRSSDGTHEAGRPRHRRLTRAR